MKKKKEKKKAKLVSILKFMSILLLCLNGFAYGQTINHHQALSSQGFSVKLNNGMYVSQTVGQQNVIGNYEKKGYAYGQGYQQGYRRNLKKRSAFPSVTTINYPNPFTDQIHFQFSKSMEDVITVRISDVQGKLVFQQSKKAFNNILTVELSHLPSSNYIVQLSAFNFIYSAKILKQ